VPFKANQDCRHHIPKPEGGIAGVDSCIAKVSEIFALQGDNRMRDNELEARFLR